MLQNIKVALNLLLSLVKDLIDLKQIKENCFNTNIRAFNPVDVLEFVKNILQLQAESKRIELSYKTVESSLLANPELSASKFKKLVQTDLPETLLGDELRLK